MLEKLKVFSPSCDVGEDDVDCLALDTNRQNSLPLGVKALSRQTSGVEAKCVSSAGSHLSGGLGVTRVPAGMGLGRLAVDS
jgi:hypothetical protein